MKLTALIVARTGCSWREVWEEFDWDRISALLEHWRVEPPVDALFAAFVGYKVTRQPSEATPANDRPSWLALSPEERAAYDAKALADYARASRQGVAIKAGPRR